MLRADDGRERRMNMGKVITGHSMSLDGFIAGPNDGPERPLGESGERILAWYFSGDTDYELPSGMMTFKVSPASAELFQEVHRTIGAFVTGRRTFDIANGWGGRHPLDVPVFVVTHTVSQEWVYEGSPFLRSSRTAPKAPSSKRKRSQATMTSPWAPPASRSSASERGSSTRYT
jgi:dihydrofolate reductase